MVGVRDWELLVQVSLIHTTHTTCASGASFLR